MNKRILNTYKRLGLDTSEIEQMLKDQEAQKKKEKKKQEKEYNEKQKKLNRIKRLEKKTGLDLTDVKEKIRKE